MKNTFKFHTLLIIAILSSLSFEASARKALLVTHYGSSDDDTRSLTIDRITEDIRQTFPGIEVREAYISPIVRGNLLKKGIRKDSPVDALMRLRLEGYDSVYVQSTTIIDGFEMSEVRKNVDELAPFFSFIKLGDSLLYSPGDCEELVKILSDYPCARDEAVIYVGHGNLLPSTATYTQLDYIFANTGYSRFHVSTIEGYPDVEATIRELIPDKKIKKVTLIPLLLVCGNHTKHDIAEDFAGTLKARGYQVEIIMRGLAEVPEVRALYIKKARTLLEE